MESEKREGEQRAAVALRVGEFLSIQIRSECPQSCVKSNKSLNIFEFNPIFDLK